MTLRKTIKRATHSNIWLRYALLAPWRMVCISTSSLTGKIVSGEHSGSPSDRAAYAARVIAHYKRWLGIDRFYGKVAEVGPGSVHETSGLLLADGCAEIHVIDRFKYDGGSEDPRIHRRDIAAEKFFINNGNFDFIVSCAVLEHVCDPLKVLRSMCLALKPTGAMVHAVDCRDHGRFSDSMHDLSFLRIPETLHWPLKANGGLNRVRLSSYLEALREMRMDCRILVTTLAGVAEDAFAPAPLQELPAELVDRSRAHVDAIRRKLAEPFRSMTAEDLMVSGFALIAHSSPAAK